MWNVRGKKSTPMIMVACAVCAVITFSTFMQESSFDYQNDLRSSKPPRNTVIKRPSPSVPLPKEITHNPFCPNLKVRNNPHEYQDVTTSKPHSWWHTPEDVTSAQYSYYEVVNVQETYRMCDEIELRIHALNGRNEAKLAGGDYFRVKAFTLNDTFKAGTSSDGEVWDHGNGMYSAYVTLKWEGLVEFNVTLIHSSESVWRLDSIPKERPMRFNKTGCYVSRKNESIRENVTCNWMKFTSAEELCTVSDQETDGSSWYCAKPKSKDLSCSDWLFHIMLDVDINAELNTLNTLETGALRRGSRLISGNTTHIAVHAQINGDILDAISRLPPCDIRSTLSTTSIAGFYQNNQWFSPYCYTKEFSTKYSMIQCLANKTIHYIGDSTIRNLFTWQLTHLPILAYKKTSSRRPWYHPNNGSMITQNIRLTYQFHYFPIVKLIANVSQYPQEKHIIDSIDTKGDAVVFVSLWAHYTYLPVSYFRKRILAILDAADRLHQRNPRAVILFMSPNTRTHFLTLSDAAIRSDWYARRMGWMLREMLGSRPRPYIGIIDVWGISLAQLAVDNIHPLDPHLENLNRVLLSTICP